MMKEEKGRILQLGLWQRQLFKDYETINWSYKLNLAPPSLLVVEVQSYWGQWDPLTRELKISTRLIENYPWVIVIQVLKHEIAHQLVTDRLGIEDGHGAHFQKFCELIGVDPRFRQSKSRIPMDHIDFSNTKNWMPQGEMSDDPKEREAMRLIERTKRLLALAQSANESESLLAIEKVKELYEKHNLAWLSEKSSDAGFRLLQIDLQSQKYSAIYSLISSILTENFCVEVIRSYTYDPLKMTPSKTLEILGTKENLIMAEYVFYFLTQQLDQLWKTYSKSNQIKGSHKRSYQLGVLHGFRNKLKATKKEHPSDSKGPQESTQNRSLVLFKKNEAFSNFMRSHYPRLRTVASSQGRIFGSSFDEGQKEGRSLNLNRPVESPASRGSILPKAIRFLR